MLMTCISLDGETRQVRKGVDVGRMQYASAILLQEQDRMLQGVKVLLPDDLKEQWLSQGKYLLLEKLSRQRRKSKGEFLVGVEPSAELTSHAFFVARVNSQKTDLQRVFQDDRSQPLSLMLSARFGGYAHMACILPAGKIMAVSGDSGLIYAFFNGRNLIHTTAIGRRLDEGFDDEAEAVQREMRHLFPKTARTF